MSLISILETIFIGPLKLCFEIIFDIAYRVIGHPGLSIIILSLVMNVLVLPLYKRADTMQEAARDVDLKLRKGVAHIKKTFSGDERMMILQTYYRQNDYRPTDALNGSVSLLLEIPFFMAAYQFLSHLQILNGVSFGPIQDLGAPDGLLVIGGIAINVLPFLMTTVNVISSAIYLKGFPLKTKIQLYGMALFFLVFLYTSPSCLVFYWTLNNVFSLVKTIFYKLKNPGKILRCLLLSCGLAIAVFGAFFYNTPTLRIRVLIIGVGLMMLLPALFSLLKTRLPLPKMPTQTQFKKKNFVLCGLFLTILIGLLIPSNFIAASPQEYVDVSYFYNPLWFLVSSTCLAGGFFLVWLGVFYWLASPGGKVLFDKLLWILCGVTLVDYMFFGNDLGVITSGLQYVDGLRFTTGEQLLNLAVIGGVTVLMYLLYHKGSRYLGTVLLTAIIAAGGMSVVNIMTTHNSISAITMNEEQRSDIPDLTFSTKGKNVVVLMLDRAMGQYVPYLFNENPELEDKFDGFTYYANTISFGASTNFGTPPLFGGYEYTPVEMNKRNTEPLVDKHNEALKVMPVLFAENGYDVTFCDPVYANYHWLPDLSIFDEYANIDAYITEGKFSDPVQSAQAINANNRNFFVFSAMKTLPAVLQPVLYNGGRYHNLNTEAQDIKSVSKANGLSLSYMKWYNVITNLSSMTEIAQSDVNQFLILTNAMTHEPMLLQEPDYTPSQYVDNTAYDSEHADRFTLNGKTLKTETVQQMSHYQTNMAALMRIADWLDHLRANGVYDNTRIIIVSDHGRFLEHLEDLSHDQTGWDMETFYPLLMVKDFNSTGFTTSDTFMTNADVPTIAFQGLIENPVNPFTGKLINSDEKYAHDQFVILSLVADIMENNGNTFLPSQWASVTNNLWDKNDWQFFLEETVLTEHQFPN